MKQPGKTTRKAKVAAAEAARLKAAETVFLKFYEESSWAHDKVRSGTAALTPESVAFMQTELARRADKSAHEADLAAQNDAADLAVKIAANAL